nr:hypothetical protein [Tanacetum cinerariifolium]
MQQKVEQLQAQLRDLKGKSSDTPSASHTLDPLNQKLESMIVELEFQVANYECEISHLNNTYKNMFDSITSNRAHAKLHNLIYENAQLRARLFENTFESKNNTSGMSVTPHVDKPKLSVVTPHSKKLHVSMPSHSVPQPKKFNVVKHSNVIAPGMFKVNPSQTSRVWKPKQVGFKERLSPKPRLPRFSLKWSSSGRNFDLKETLVASKETNVPNDDKACTSNPQEPMRKWFPNSTVFLGRLSKFVCGTVRFGNDHIAAILGYGNLKWGNIMSPPKRALDEIRVRRCDVIEHLKYKA